MRISAIPDCKEAQLDKPIVLGMYGTASKRIFDLVLFSLSIPFVLPLLAVLWAVVRLDGGAGFYRQRRVGQDGQVFEILKLRTMVTNAPQVFADHLAANPEAAAEWQDKQKLLKDPRITRFGRCLRKSGLDELPQVLNVLRGDMSFVGPRPFTIEQEREYRLAGGSAYYRLKPGITGLWQVSGRNDTSFRDRVQYDNQYLSTLSFAEDLRLLAMTVPTVLLGKGC